MCAEASRGQRLLLVLLGQVMFRQQYTLESMTETMKSSKKVNQLDTDFVFDVFKQAVDAIDMAETQLLRGKVSQIVNARGVKQVETKLKDLIHRSVTAGNIAKICKVGDEVSRLKDQQEI